MKNHRGVRRRSQAETLDPGSSLLVHDIKNLSFRLGALLRNLESSYEDPQFKKSVLEVLTDTVKRMDGIVRRCRDRKDEVIIKLPVDLNEVLNGIVERVPRYDQGPKHIFIEARYGRVPKIWGDPEFLSEAFAILVQNALEAMEETGGRLALSTEASVTRMGDRTIVVKVADTGCGMPAGFIKDGLFAPFVTTKAGGLGMGLYACRKIIALHDGAIRVFSREGRGTTFRITFKAR
jgi:signal transduction histidine kinase